MAKIIWKTKEEIEAEKNAPKPATEAERIATLEQATNDIIMLMMMI